MRRVVLRPVSWTQLQLSTDCLQYIVLTECFLEPREQSLSYEKKQKEKCKHGTVLLLTLLTRLLSTSHDKFKRILSTFLCDFKNCSYSGFSSKLNTTQFSTYLLPNSSTSQPLPVYLAPFAVKGFLSLESFHFSRTAICIRSIYNLLNRVYHIFINIYV